ncbi:MAG: helix-turn-helix domain-containing protein [Methyloceanibacter sp.]
MARKRREPFDENEQSRRAELANRVRVARLRRGIKSQEAAAEQADVGVSTYKDLETGQGNISTKHLWRVADALRVHVTDLLGDPEPEDDLLQ